VAAPFTKGDQWANVRRSVDAAQDLRLIGFLPFNPLLAQLGHFVHPMTYEEHLAEDLAWLIVCDAVFRVPGDSDGADRECALARALRIPVFTDLWTLTVHFFPDRK
jgi:hypothetical protein